MRRKLRFERAGFLKLFYGGQSESLRNILCSWHRDPGRVGVQSLGEHSQAPRPCGVTEEAERPDLTFQ